MKNLIYILLPVLLVACSQPQEKQQEAIKSDPKDLIGAWKAEWMKDSVPMIGIAIVSDGYIGEAVYTKDGYFIKAYGGLWTASSDTFNYTFEFHTADTTMVGKTKNLAYQIKGDTIEFPHDERLWTRVDDGTPGELSGAWLITGRKRDGEISRWTPDARKTMKILSGTRFQWIAYNTETTQFFGTGGGTYTADNGKYTEIIEFFSRDSSRVGARLEFDYMLDSGEWYHTGFSSKGDSLYEIWTPRSMLE